MINEMRVVVRCGLCVCVVCAVLCMNIVMNKIIFNV